VLRTLELLEPPPELEELEELEPHAAATSTKTAVPMMAATFLLDHI
jgi:hypothetical protein